VVAGHYEIQVASEAEVHGCGAAGSELLLWVFVNDQYYFSTETAPWPGGGSSATFDASFSSDDPAGASTPVTELKGRLLDGAGNELPAGTVVEAFVGETLCGATSLRYGSSTEDLYTLVVAGPGAVPECTEDATMTFRLDGTPAVETAVNDLRTGSRGHELDLHMRP
jgi:hypothetical protein